jgi:hypothetical protein
VETPNIHHITDHPYYSHQRSSRRTEGVLKLERAPGHDAPFLPAPKSKRQKNHNNSTTNRSTQPIGTEIADQSRNPHELCRIEKRSATESGEDDEQRRSLESTKNETGKPSADRCERGLGRGGKPWGSMRRGEGNSGDETCGFGCVWLQGSESDERVGVDIIRGKSGGLGLLK